VIGLASGSDRRARYHGWIMSEYTEPLEDLAKRIASAKEFL
jgi:hypothetical protein